MAGEADLPAHTRAEAVPLSREYRRFEGEVNGGFSESLVKNRAIGRSGHLYPRKLESFEMPERNPMDRWSDLPDKPILRFDRSR
jgi:hypothetical protein